MGERCAGTAKRRSEPASATNKEPETEERDDDGCERDPERETQAEADLAGPWTGLAGTDRRVLEMTRVTVAKIDRDPALVRLGLKNIKRWTRQYTGYLPRCHAEWKELIETHPWKHLPEILLEESDERITYLTPPEFPRIHSRPS